MSARVIELSGKPIATTTLDLEKYPGVYNSCTLEMGVPVKVLIITRDDDEMDALEHLIQAVDDLEGLLVSDLDAIEPWTGEIDHLLHTLEKARGIAQR